jgi:hypothetical protein
MPCPTCGAEDVVPLTLTQFNGLAGAAKLCEECRAVFLVVDEARLPAALRASSTRDRQVAGWKAVRAVLRDTVDALVDHPATHAFFSREDVETDVWRSDALDVIERAVAAFVPILRGLAE